MARGGKRRGAGRPTGTAGTIAAKTLERQSDAENMLAKLGGDGLWEWALTEAKKKKDYRTVVEIGKYWTDRAKGKAPQALNLKTDTPFVISFRRDPPTPEVVTPDRPAR